MVFLHFPKIKDIGEDEVRESNKGNPFDEAIQPDQGKAPTGIALVSCW